MEEAAHLDSEPQKSTCDVLNLPPCRRPCDTTAAECVRPNPWRRVARLLFALIVHRAHMRPQLARLPKRSFALRARVVFALLVHHAHMLPQIVRLPKRSVALRARVVSALLVYRAHMRLQMAGVTGLVVALRARVSPRFGLFPHGPTRV